MVHIPKAAVVVRFDDPAAVPCALCGSGGEILNMIIANPTTYKAPDGHSLVVATAAAGIGGRWDGRAFIRPPERSDIPRAKSPVEIELEVIRAENAHLRRALLEKGVLNEDDLDLAEVLK